MHLKRLAGPRAQQDPDRLVFDPAGHECQRIHRLDVQPVRVIDTDDQRLARCHLRQQRQHACIHSQPVGRIIPPSPERQLDRPRLARWQRLQTPQNRSEELIQPCIRQRRLRRHPHDAQPLHVCRLSLGVPKQGRLADSRLAEHRQRATGSSADLIQQPVDLSRLARAANQHVANLTRPARRVTSSTARQAGMGAPPQPRGAAAPLGRARSTRGLAPLRGVGTPPLRSRWCGPPEPTERHVGDRGSLNGMQQ